MLNLSLVTANKKLIINNYMANKYQEIKYIYLIEQMLIWLRKLDSNIRCEQREKKILNIDKNNDGKY